MAVDKNTKSMLNPYSSGQNFGIDTKESLASLNNEPTNYHEALSANQRFSVTESLLSKVTSTGASGQENFKGLEPGGIGLGKPLGSDGKDN